MLQFVLQFLLQKLLQDKYGDEIRRRSSLVAEIDKLSQDLKYTNVCLDR